MKELNKKTFLTIFVILSSFMISSLIILNIQSYNKEYESIRRNLTFSDNNHRLKDDDKFEDNNRPDIDNMKIFDYEVYTVELENGQIKKVISHSTVDNEFDAKGIAKSIIKDNDPSTMKINNLYFSKYSYNYKLNNSVVIINTENIRGKLIDLLINSVIIGIVLEFIIYFMSRMITAWITKPALDSFERQKNFIADASHELKTPLAVIMASADEIHGSRNNQKYIDNIKYESERMKSLIASMLDLSKIENGSLKDTYKYNNISKIIKKICLTFEAIAFEEEVQIVTDIEDDIILNCNKEEIEKLISIILDNAIKHSYKRKIIDVRVNRLKSNIIIAITNSGDPIKPGDEEKIFERFYRSDKSRNRGEGRYGLGLAIAKNIVNNYNGTIKAFSSDGETTFKIVIKK